MKNIFYRLNVIVFLFTGLLSPVKSVSQPLKFSHYFTTDGLSSNRIISICQDRSGFLWVGTREGLNKFDGSTFTVYKHDPDVPGSISQSMARSIYEDRQGNLWIGTFNGGLNLYDRASDSFKTFKVGNSEISSLYEDSHNNLWIATLEDGLVLFDRATKAFTHFKHDPNNPSSISDNLVRSIVEDDNGFVWVGTQNGLNKLDVASRTFTRFYSIENVWLGGFQIFAMKMDSDQNLWMGTLGAGLIRYNIRSKAFQHYTHRPDDPSSLANNDIKSLAFGTEGNVWVGTVNGLNIIDKKSGAVSTHKLDLNNPHSLSNSSIETMCLGSGGVMWLGSFNGLNVYVKNHFRHYSHNPMNQNSIISNRVSGFYEDTEGKIWITVDPGGLDRFDPKTETFWHIVPDEKKQNKLGSVSPISIKGDGNGNILIGTYDRGFHVYNIQKSEFSHYGYVPPDPTTISNQAVSSILLDKEKRLWLGTWFNGFNQFDLSTGKATRILHDPNNKNTLNFNVVHTMFEDSKGNFWIGLLLGGLDRFDRETGNYTHHVNDPSISGSISNNNVNCIFEDSQGNLWVGTDGGLNKYDYQTKQFRVFNEKDGIANDAIQGILEDNKGNLWISTSRGITKFNLASKMIKNYTGEDGLQGEDYMRNACIKLRSGHMCFGGTNGFNYFHPDSIKDNPFIPPVFITQFQLFNKPVRVAAPGSPLSKHISQTEEITLAYDQSVLSFEFAALNYTIPSKNTYAYKLEGFDKDWNNVGTKRTATYTNLDPGSYVLHVKASNNDGVWNETGTKLLITITPPYWMTWWFRSMVVILVVGAAVSWYKIRINSIKKQKAELERQVKERTLEVTMQKEELQAQAEELLAINEQVKSQSEKVEELYTEIKDSIRAAEVIQKSILPSDMLIKKHLPDSFVLFRPKDVVSGDFYWFSNASGKFIIAAVDCTGHGVAGAFMSITGHHLLERAIQQSPSLCASEILHNLNEGLIRMLHEDKDNADLQDGMDIALCVVDKNKSELQFAGANSPLYYVREGELHQVKGNGYSIGLTIGEGQLAFTNHIIPIRSHDTFYIFSDGFADQLGGENGETKLMYSRFRQMLLNNHRDPLPLQKEKLEQQFADWQGSTDQLDDVMVIGFRVNATA